MYVQYIQKRNKGSQCNQLRRPRTRKTNICKQMKSKQRDKNLNLFNKRHSVQPTKATEDRKQEK